MPLQKVLFKPGVNRENTRYTTEGGWYECDKIRFRQGNPEKIGGWTPFSGNTFRGVCRSLWNWVTLALQNLIGVGTNLKFYINQGGAFYDVTPIRTTATLGTDPFTANGTTTVTVAATSHGAINNDFVTFSGATGTYAALLNNEFQITYVNENSYTITVASAIPAGSYGGAAVSAAYQLNTGPAYAVAQTGWGAGAWGAGAWGVGATSSTSIQIWNQANFGQNLVYGPRGGGVYYWTASGGVLTRGVNLTTLGDADTPLFQNVLVVSDASRFVIVMGTNDYGSSTKEPMLIRWSDQENPLIWTPAITNQAGSVRLSRGSEIVTAIQTRQEVFVLTDQAAYSLQYLGPPVVWGTQIVGDNISIIGPKAVALASGVVYWMGIDKFYMYDGRVQTLNCDLRRFIFNDFNRFQNLQVYASTNEGFNEIWWFYCSANSQQNDRYVVYNYAENVWYYGTLGRSAWLDSGLLNYPIATNYDSGTQTGKILNHEDGIDDVTNGAPVPINAYISSSEFDIGDGHNFGFVWRVLPDLTFSDSYANGSQQPQVTMTLYPLASSGSGTGTPASAAVTRAATYTITEEFTGIIYTRVRGRQMIMKIESNQVGTTWQLGAPRIDIRPDGRR